MSIRTSRVAEEIQKVISERLVRGLRDPLPGFVTVRGVEVTSDFTHAKIWVSVFGSDAQKKGAIDGLNTQRGVLRYEVGQKIRLRNTPQLTFVLDESSERAARVHALLDEVKEHEKAIVKRQKAVAAAEAAQAANPDSTTTTTTSTTAEAPVASPAAPLPTAPTATAAHAMTTTQAPAKKAPAKKAPAKKAPAKKATAKKAPAKKAPAKKAPAKKAPAKKKAAKKAPAKKKATK